MTEIQELVKENPEAFPGSSVNEEGEEVIENEERGCGHLNKGKGYVRADGVPGGSLPRMSVIDENQRIPFKEDHFRTWKTFPGLEFELSLVRQAADLDPEESSAMEYVSALSNSNVIEPEGEVWRHIKRLSGDAPLSEGDHFGIMPAAKAQDLVMWVGETYYPEPEDYIEETQERGLNKAISVSKRNPPPEINPGRTRLWLIHPKGIDNASDLPEEKAEGMEENGDRYTAAIIGYCYLTRCIYTRDADGMVPEYVETLDAVDKVDVVEVGEKISEEEAAEAEEEPSKAEKAAADPDQADLETATDGGGSDE